MKRAATVCRARSLTARKVICPALLCICRRCSGCAIPRNRNGFYLLLWRRRHSGEGRCRQTSRLPRRPRSPVGSRQQTKIHSERSPLNSVLRACIMPVGNTNGAVCCRDIVFREVRCGGCDTAVGCRVNPRYRVTHGGGRAVVTELRRTIVLLRGTIVNRTKYCH